ncbi:MAG: glutamate 5-kinase [Maritimibacter sp.]
MATLTTAKRVVVKIGSALLVQAGEGTLKRAWLDSLCEDVAALRAGGKDVVLVSSGSIGLGRAALNLPAGTLALEQSQAAAAVGQVRLVRAYEDALAARGIVSAQVLLTLDDSLDRRRYLNTRATLEQLLALGVVPIVNENDTIATDEIRYGDNDRLAAQVAVTIEADLTILLSDVDGFYSGNPKVDASAQHFPVVQELTPELLAMGGDAIGGLSKGGMKTKLIAAQTATAAGCGLIITLGEPLNPLKTLENGGRSTLFVARDDPKAARIQWISAMKSQGAILLDAGAVRAIKKGKSLLPVGIIGVEGDFERGDPVEMIGPDDVRLGAGLTRYTAKEARALIGKHTDEIEEALGYPGRASLIHRDDMAL